MHSSRARRAFLSALVAQLIILHQSAFFRANDDSSAMDPSTGLPSASDRPVLTSPSQPVDTAASVASALVHNLIAASCRNPVGGNVSWPPASSGATAAPPATAAPQPESYVPSVRSELKGRFWGTSRTKPSDPLRSQVGRQTGYLQTKVHRSPFRSCS